MLSHKRWALGLGILAVAIVFVSVTRRSGCAAAVCIRSPAQRDALHVGFGVGAVHQLQPAS